MKIALCTETLYPMYGVERIVYETAKRLLEKGIDVTVYTSTTPKKLPELKIIQVSRPTITSPPKRNYAFCSAFTTNLFLKLLKSDCDIVDARGHLSLIPCSAAAKIRKKISFAAIYDVYANQWKEMYGGTLPSFGKLLEAVSFRMPFDKIVVINSSNKRELIRHFGINPEKIEILPHAIDVKSLDSVSGGTVKRSQILFAGRLAPQKDVSLLIRAFADLPEKIRSRYELKIVGIGSELDNLRKLAHELGTDVTFVGNIPNHDDLVREMKKSEIFVMPSIRESLGIAILEAMACKTPIISTATEGPSDYIESGKNGFLVRIGDEKDLSSRLLEILSNERLRKHFADAGIKTAKEHDWDKGIGELIRLYETAMQSH